MRKEEEAILVLVALAIVLILGLIIYFMPTLIARMRRSAKTKSVFLVNLLTGWTVAGWAVALALAVFSENRAEAQRRRQIEHRILRGP